MTATNTVTLAGEKRASIFNRSTLDMSAPSKRDILEKYRDRIGQDDFELLINEEIPPPEQSRHNRIEYQFLGKINGWSLWAKRTVGTLIAIIASFGGFMQGLEYIDKYARISYDQISPLFESAKKHPNQPATSYAIVESPPSFGIWSDDDQLHVSINASPDHQLPVKEPIQFDLPAGSGIVPYSSNWT